MRSPGMSAMKTISTSLLALYTISCKLSSLSLQSVRSLSSGSTHDGDWNGCHSALNISTRGSYILQCQCFHIVDVTTVISTSHFIFQNNKPFILLCTNDYSRFPLEQWTTYTVYRCTCRCCATYLLFNKTLHPPTKDPQSFLLFQFLSIPVFMPHSRQISLDFELEHLLLDE